MGSSILVIGGGFAGVSVARGLDARAEVTIVSETNFLLFTPMLAEVAAADVDPRHIISPVRQLCPHARLVQGEVLAIDPARRSVSVRPPFGGDPIELEADAMVLAMGGISATFGVPGVADLALPFKTISDGLRIRNRVLALLERASEQPDPDLTHVAVVGAGYSGAELAAALADFLSRAWPQFYSTAPPPRVTLIDAVERVVPMLPARLGSKAEQALRERGGSDHPGYIGVPGHPERCQPRRRADGRGGHGGVGGWRPAAPFGGDAGSANRSGTAGHRRPAAGGTRRICPRRPGGGARRTGRHLTPDGTVRPQAGQVPRTASPRVDRRRQGTQLPLQHHWPVGLAWGTATQWAW